MSKPHHPHAQRRSLYKAFAASLSGTSLEWYDFAIYSASAAQIGPPLGTLMANGVLASGLRAWSPWSACRWDALSTTT